MLNVGLIAPGEIIDSAIAFAKQNNVPVNSLEGFVRQLIGWREFIFVLCRPCAVKTKAAKQLIFIFFSIKDDLVQFLV